MKRIRPTIATPGVGKARYDMIASAISRYNDACYHNYYLEAIVILDSLVADRLESYYNQMTNTSDASYLPIGQICHKCQKEGLSLDGLVEIALRWTNERNLAVHEMAKLDPSSSCTFEDKYKKMASVATAGMRLFRRLSAEVKRQQRILERQKKREAMNAQSSSSI